MRPTIAPTTPTPTTPAPGESARERLAVYGVDALGDVEILSLLLPGKAAMARARAILDAGGLHAIATDAIEGSARDVAILRAAVELGRRLARLELPYASALRGPDDVARFARSMWGSADVETFVAIGLDARQRVRLVREIAVGSVAQVDVHPREVFRALVRAGMHSCIVVHNHPSGEPEPSQADIDLTRRLADVGRILGIPVLDHLVVTRTRSCSLAAMGLVPGG